MKRFVFPSLILLLLPSAAIHARQESQSPVSTLEQMQEDLQEIPCQPKKRLSAVRRLFEKMGATSPDASVMKSGAAKNYVVMREGTGPEMPEMIVMGAHYDFAKEGCGAVDNWTGVVMLAHMYRTISHLNPSQTVWFVAFDQEEDGRVGSRAMVQSILKTGTSRYCAMLNFDSFGMGKTFAIEQISSLKLVQLGAVLAEGLQVPFSSKVISGDSDSTSFLKQGIPAITLSGLSDGWGSVLHTKKDQQNAISTDSVFEGYRLALSMWSSIDAAPCDSYRAHP